MNPMSLIGAFLITMALLSYGIGCISVQRFKIVTKGVVFFISLGVFLDLIAVTFMIIGSENSPFSYHGFLGYSAMITIIVDLYLIVRIYMKNGKDSLIGKKVLLYSKIAYAWWVIAYFTGSVLVLWN